LVRIKELDAMTTVALTALGLERDEALDMLADKLDLTNVRMKLADPEEGHGFSIEELDVREAEYRKFLVLHLMYPDADIVPCKIVDDIWHQHILDTAAYRDDCQAIFGHFLDHFPYFGMRDEKDAQDLEDAYELTLERYEAAFGPSPAETWRTIEPMSKCKRTACKPQKCR
jgi:hypothetical protein